MLSKERPSLFDHFGGSLMLATDRSIGSPAMTRNKTKQAGRLGKIPIGLDENRLAVVGHKPKQTDLEFKRDSHDALLSERAG
jgi:hypothetical protein